MVGPAIARNDPAYYPSLVANSVLGGGYSARLSQEIRVKRGLSYGAGSSVSARRTTGAFSARAQTKMKRGSPGWTRAQDIINQGKSAKKK